MLPPEPNNFSGKYLHDYLTDLHAELFLKQECTHIPKVEPHGTVNTLAPIISDASSWSNKIAEAKDWEPTPGHPGYFTDPDGIWQSVTKGQVPADVLERFAIKEPISKRETDEQRVFETEIE